MIGLKMQSLFFSGVATMNTTSSLLQTIKINNAALAVTQLKVFNTS
jgi:hypothetical protein